MINKFYRRQNVVNSVLIKGLNRQTFRKMIEDKNKVFKDLIVRIRQDENDLVYYNGNKALLK